MELYKKYRPKTLDEMVGQTAAVNTLKTAIKHDSVPHFILFTGPSGCGKTTLARIVRRKLRCSRHDFIEDAPRKIEDVRAIKRRIHQAPMQGKCRVWLIDECHKLTSDAQDEFLKMLEDTPSHVYFLFTTTDPQKLKKTIKTRSLEIAVKPIRDKVLMELIEHICDEENVSLEDEVVEKIVENSESSARKALVLLDSVVNLSSVEEQLDAIASATAERQAFDIVRALLYNRGTSWSDMAEILKEAAGEDPEQIRWLVLACCKTEMLKAGKLAPRAYEIIEAFRDNYYDCKMAGLVASCYEVIQSAD
jgi:DNA polymerase-3 subunit gamma/tau